jgi:hypothetical protein
VSDVLPACPRCGDLCPRRAVRCPACDARLYVDDPPKRAKGKRAPRAAREPSGDLVPIGPLVDAELDRLLDAEIERLLSGYYEGR